MILSRIAMLAVLCGTLLCAGSFILRAQAQAPGYYEAKRNVLSLSTNIPYDITYIPGYGITTIPSFTLEFCPAGGKFSFGADVEWPMWKHPDEHRYMQVNNLTLWARRYFNPAEDHMNGLYLLANVNAARYGVGFDKKGWEGEGAGASLGIGYKKMLGKGRCFLDMGLALGAFLARQDPYVWGDDANNWYYYDYSGDPAEFKERNQRFFWAGPTRVYISFGVELFGRKTEK
ncbi:MAG: DUF3575 domain-containing protein [Bacteroidales bacterium]|nr:DUF3575 domain-containing protein [Bacteroidales bacterium]